MQKKIKNEATNKQQKRQKNKNKTKQKERSIFNIFQQDKQDYDIPLCFAYKHLLNLSSKQKAKYSFYVAGIVSLLLKI